ncbi:hypothetical protein DPMN_185288 [Dreissena polymorpha]|uniref:Uncharacterized protein n=1 Tax=Dreissena polymorpha TaxID=45954 RepID=A0A9D4DMI2_DREPO|nr:hypothetical protein DPMN_185288 [Dreissena polymorpha]
MVNHYLVYDGCQFGLLGLNQSQLDARSAALPRAWIVVFLTLPSAPSAPNIFHTYCDGNPLHPTSTGKIHVFQPLSLHTSARSWYLAFFSS